MSTELKKTARTLANLRYTKTLLLNVGDPEVKREEILDYFRRTWEIDEHLFYPLIEDETFYLRADPLRHPLIFYFGHTAAFYINKLVIANIISNRVNPHFESLFAVGVDEMSWDDLNEEHYDWPSVAEVKAFRDNVRRVVEGLITTLPLNIPINWQNPFWCIMMGIEHARIHLETSSVLIRQLPVERLRTAALWEICRDSEEAPTNELLSIPSGKVTLGKAKDHPLYGWDNEYGSFETEIKELKASKYLVSNQEYLAFVKDSGYQSNKWWTEEGWNWLTYRQTEHPVFWVKNEETFQLRTMLEVIDMPWDWPVEVNYLEAKAFCNWKSVKTGKKLRMPTEAEWYYLRALHDIPDQPYWDKAPGNINLEHFASPCPVGRFCFNGLFDIIGNVWQWTETTISGFHGFEVHPFYDDFSTPTFDAKHNLMKGGSWISTGNEATKDSRYAFRRHFFQHAGFRYIESEANIVAKNEIYETDQLVSQYCEFHYGDTYHGVANYPKSCVKRIMQAIADRPKRRALDLGCATGRATFELAKHFDSVCGLDFSARFIKIGTQLKEQGSLHYTLPEEGDILSFHDIYLKDLDLDCVRDTVEFYPADACNLLPRYTGYDLVFAGNLVDRLYDPERFLQLIRERINIGGLLVLSSPYTWLEEYTEKDKWLGGYRRDGEAVSTLDGLKRTLSKHFRLTTEPIDIPFVIRETKRKFQHSLAQMTIWQRTQ